MKRPRTMFVISLLVLSVVFFSRCAGNHSPASGDPRGDQYAGAKTCVNCHKDIFNSYTHTNHYKTSSSVTAGMPGKLAGISGNNFFFTDSSHIRIGEKGDSLFQSYYANDSLLVSARFDIAFGSAEKAQTYGYWKEDKLYQLPLTYFASMNAWANSPGFPIGHARFDRVIESRCFECHASYVDKEFVKSGSVAVTEKLDRNSIIYGIDCERCHGPAAAHVQFHQANPAVKKSMYMTAMKSLSRQQQLDACATCHSGNDQERQRSLFSFRPGDTLSHFYYPDFGSDRHEPDVHGKQVQLLQASLCFQRSGMTCGSCHDSHKGENEIIPFLSKCMGCHQGSGHALRMDREYTETAKSDNLVTRNCIDCHMPLQTSKTIYFDNGAGSRTLPYFLRTHKIAVYK